MMFEYGTEGDDLIQNLKLHVQRFANNYNPEIDWQLFMYYSPSPFPVWCLNCFIFSDPSTK